MSLRDKYIIGDLLQDGLIRCYAARDPATNREVLIHLGRGDRIDFLRRSALDYPLSGEAIDEGRDGNSMYVVTARKAESAPPEDLFRQRRGWKAAPAEKLPSSPEPPTRIIPTAPATESEVGEFTRMFQAPPPAAEATATHVSIPLEGKTAILPKPD